MFQAEASLGKKRVEANRIKSALEAEIAAHSEAKKRVRGLERLMQVHHLGGNQGNLSTELSVTGCIF